MIVRTMSTALVALTFASSCSGIAASNAALIRHADAIEHVLVVPSIVRGSTDDAKSPPLPITQQQERLLQEWASQGISEGLIQVDWSAVDTAEAGANIDSLDILNDRFARMAPTLFDSGGAISRFVVAKDAGEDESSNRDRAIRKSGTEPVLGKLAVQHADNANADALIISRISASGVPRHHYDSSLDWQLPAGVVIAKRAAEAYRGQSFTPADGDGITWKFNFELILVDGATGEILWGRTESIVPAAFDRAAVIRPIGAVFSRIHGIENPTSPWDTENN